MEWLKCRYADDARLDVSVLNVNAKMPQPKSEQDFRLTVRVGKRRTRQRSDRVCTTVIL